MKETLLLIEKGFTILSLLILTGAWFPRLYEITTGESLITNASEATVLLQLPFYFIYIVTFFLLYLRWKKLFRVLLEGKLLLLLVGIAFVSVFWSDVPLVTLRRGAGLLGATSFGIYLATRYDAKEQLQLLAWAVGMAVLSSLLFTIAMPSAAIISDPIAAGFGGAYWQGVYIHKNIFGRLMGLTVIVLALVALSIQKYRNLAWIGCSIASALLILSAAKSSWINTITLLALLPLYRALRWRFSWMLLLYIIIALVGGSIATLLISNADVVLGSLGKDLTFTGRTKVWSAVIEKIAEHPWLGYGYNGFWRGDEGGSAYVRLVSGWKVSFSHNGLLDLWLDLGLIGVLVYVSGFIKACLQAITWVRWSKTSYGFWYLMLLTLIFLTNYSESSILKPNDVFWVLYTATYFSLSPSPINV